MKGKSRGALRVLVLLAASTPAMAQYVGTSPGDPGGPPASPSTAVSGDFAIYPKTGQTREQQSADLYQCYNWAKGQTGYDPTQSNGGVAPDAVTSRRDEYRRAMTVCLRARGYDVHYAAAAASPPPPLPPATSTSLPPPSAAPGAIIGGPEPVFATPELKYQPLSGQIAGGYTATAGMTNNDLKGGGNIGLGLTWFPTDALPIGLRADGTYMWFHARQALLDANGGNFSFGYQHVYGGDLDVQLDLAHKSPSVKLYLIGGIGRYRVETTLKQVSIVNGIGCFAWFCGPAQFPAITAVERVTSPWLRSWNAGFGMEFALADHASFFVEARYLRILPNSSKMEFVPIRVGLRF